MGLSINFRDFAELRLRAGTAFRTEGAKGMFSVFTLPGGGRAWCDTVTLFDKLTLTVARLDLKEKIELEVPQGSTIPMSMFYSSGGIEVPLDERDLWRGDPTRAGLLRAPNARTDLMYVRVSPGAPYRFIRLDFDPEFFFDAARNVGIEPPSSLKSALAAHDGHVIHDFASRASARMCVAQICECVYEGTFRLAYLHAKTLELMALGFRDMFQPEAQSPDRAAMPPALRYRVEKAHALLVGDPAHAPTIPELAATVRLSETALKAAFRALYGDSIMSYRKELRLERARQLLRATNSSVLAVAGAVGYSCAGRFAMAFRRRYGVSPGEYARQARSERRDRHSRTSEPALTQ